jgi:hypothetical protein
MSEEKRSSIRHETLLDAEIRSSKIPYRFFPGVVRNYSHDGLNFISEDFNPEPKEVLELKIKHSVHKTHSHAIGEIVWYEHVNTRCYVGLKIKEINEKL